MNQLESSPFFPVAFKDEHYLSFMKRWAVLSGASNLSRGIVSLMGKKQTYISELVQPRFLAHFANSLPNYIDKEKFFREHSQEKFAMMLERDNEDGYFVVPELKEKNSSFNKRHLRWCAGCAREDISSLGVSYWRNSHQDPRLLRCQKHHLSLLETCHKCKRKQKLVSQLSQPTAKAECQYCFEPIDHKIMRDLTPFQCWLEQLHHLANHGVRFNRHDLIKRVQHIVELYRANMKMKPRKSWVLPEKVFIDAFNSTRACDHFSFGEIPYAAIGSYSGLKLDNLLNPTIQQSPVLYALLAWVFLSNEERDACFGFFADGKAVQVQS